MANLRKGRLRLPRPALVCLFGVLFGISGTFMVSTVRRIPHITFCDTITSKWNERELVLIGVMTAAKYVNTRAYNVWKTWAKDIPGKMHLAKRISRARAVRALNKKHRSVTDEVGQKPKRVVSSRSFMHVALEVSENRGPEEDEVQDQTNFVQVIFFVAENTVSKYKDMPIVQLKGVTDVYPPQKKSFAMLKWMADHHLNDFYWFMRADDDLYVRGDRLEQFLRSLDSTKPHLIGQAGLGNTAEYGQLSLGQQDNYCMGGPGVVISHETIKLVSPHLRSCLMELLTNHEDVELGRCIRKHVGISCTWNYEMNKLFHNNQTVPNAYHRELSELSPSITLHPIKKPSIMRRVHLYNRALKLADLRSRQILLREQLDDSNRMPLMRFKANTTYDLHQWNFISSNNILFCTNEVNCPRHTVNADTRSAISNIIEKLFEDFNSNARQRGRILQYQGLQYGYTRLEPRFGVDYILDMVLWFKKFRKPHRATISVRRHAYIQQTFGAIKATTDNNFREMLRQKTSKLSRLMTMNISEDVDWSYASLPEENSHIYILLPLAGRAEIFKRFARHLRTVCRDATQFSLIVIIFRTGDSEDAIISTVLNELMEEIDVKIVDMGNAPFSRGLALARGASIMQPDALLFFTDVDMVFTCDALDRIRRNTIRGAQVYFPIVFSEFSPESWSNSDKVLDDAFHYGRRRGYFRHFGFGLASMYKSDLELVGGLNESIQGWGMEDVDLFEKNIKSPLRILRTPEPGLVHKFHKIRCDETMPASQYEMCIGSKAASLASLDSLVDQLSLYP